MLNPKGPSHFKSSLRTPAILLVAGVTLTACSARPGPRPASATPEAEPSPVRSVGTMSELMVDILYPASDAVFYIETRTPSTGEEWALLQMQTLMLAEAANLLMMPERAVDQDQWMVDSRLMLDAGEAAYRAAKDRDVAALAALNDQLYTSCFECHDHYRPGYGA